MFYGRGLIQLVERELGCKIDELEFNSGPVGGAFHLIRGQIETLELIVRAVCCLFGFGRLLVAIESDSLF